MMFILYASVTISCQVPFGDNNKLVSFPHPPTPLQACNLETRLSIDSAPVFTVAGERIAIVTNGVIMECSAAL